MTLTYQTAPSPAVTVQVEQFNAGVTSANPVPGIFSLSSSRYWDISFASGSTGNNYRLEVDIAGSGIPSPLNRVVFRSSTNPDDYSGGFPTGADVDDDGTRATQAPNFPYTNFLPDALHWDAMKAICGFQAQPEARVIGMMPLHGKMEMEIQELHRHH